jgi:outer membrane protein OmpA-like peptidoglycan-associated protein
MTLARKLAIAGAALALLVALYAAAGYWIAPGYVREALAEAAQSRGFVLEITTVRTKPFALRVELGGIALRGPEGRGFAEAESASADLAWASLWRRGWIVQELRVESPQVALGTLPQVEHRQPGGAQGEPGAALSIRNLVVENGRLSYAPADLALEALTLRAREISTLEAAAGTYETAARLAGGAGEIASRGALTLAPLAAEGTLTIAALRAAQLLPDAAGELRGEAMYGYRDGAFALHDVSIAGNGLAYAGIELPHATLRAGKVPIPPREPFEAALEASVAPGGKIAAQGRIGFAPFALHVDLSAEELPLAAAERWLPEGVAVKIESGTVSGTGLLAVAERFSYRGSAAIRDLRLEERGSGALLLAWKEGETASLGLDSAPPAIEAGEVVVRAPEGRLVIEENGAVNFAAVFPARKDEGGEGLRAGFERLRIEQGALHFADRSLATPFEATLRELSGTVVGFSSAQNNPARVRLNGRVQPYGVARIRGTINLNAPTTLADITAVFRNLRLEDFNPYVAKFAGYRIESGRLSAELRYQVREGALVGSNQLAFQNMQLGEKLEEKGILDLPLELAVALLADAEGRIDLAIPVRGNLNDPQFDMGAIVARALGNVVKKIVSAPFRALASLFGGKDDEDPGAIGFAPGSAELSPPAEENVARVAQALGERPQLGVEVHGAYDAERDRQALGMRAAREAVQSAAGVKGPLDMSNPKVMRAAEALYLKHAGDRASLEALRKSEANYPRLLLQRLAATAPVNENAAQALARERAEAVRAALLEHGVDPARVGLGETSGEAQAAATLALKPADELGAAAGAGASSSVADPVRAAQEKLNAAGYDAGPVDGILGPRTRRALIHFQAVEGLELTGELDAATRARFK